MLTAEEVFRAAMGAVRALSEVPRAAVDLGDALPVELLRDVAKLLGTEVSRFPFTTSSGELVWLDALNLYIGQVLVHGQTKTPMTDVERAHHFDTCLGCEGQLVNEVGADYDRGLCVGCTEADRAEKSRAKRSRATELREAGAL